MGSNREKIIGYKCFNQENGKGAALFRKGERRYIQRKKEERKNNSVPSEKVVSNHTINYLAKETPTICLPLH